MRTTRFWLGENGAYVVDAANVDAARALVSRLAGMPPQEAEKLPVVALQSFAQPEPPPERADGFVDPSGAIRLP